MVASKPTLLFSPFPLLAHVLRCLELGRAVKDSYHVLVAVNAEHREFVTNAGLTPVAHEQFDVSWVMKCARQFRFDWLQTESIERVYESQVALIQHTQPDLVLGDAQPTARMAAERCHTLFTGLINGYLAPSYRLTRTVSNRHPGAQYRDRVPPKLFNWLTRKIEKATFRTIHKPFRKIRKKHKLRATRLYLDELYGHDTLLLDTPVLFPQKKLPKGFQLLGPVYFQGDQQGHATAIEDLIVSDRPNVLVIMGSSGDFEHFAFLNHKHYADLNVIAAGTGASEVFYAAHTRTRPFVNLGPLLPDIDLICCHGGNGTLYQALSQGVPVLCHTSLFEQEWNVERVVELGLGASLDGIDQDTEREKMVRHWLGQKQNQALRQVQAHIALEPSLRRFRRFLHKRVSTISTHTG